MRIIFCILVLAIGGEVCAQQDAQVSLYLRNPLQFNSAHAGLDGTLRSTSIIRMQWTGWEGAPRTQFISAHAPLFRNRLGIGLTALNDASGARSQREFMGHVAYHSPELGNGIHISTGLSLGVQSAGYDFQSLMARDPNDMLLAAPYNALGFSTGAGVIMHASPWFLGFSAPHLLEQDLGNAEPIGRRNRHFYATAGYIHPLNDFIDVRAVSLVKWLADAPGVVDVNIEIWLFEVLSLGAMARYGEGVGVQTSYRFKEGWRFHYAVYFPTNGLMTRSFGSHEIGLAWDSGKRSVAYQSPRYF